MMTTQVYKSDTKYMRLSLVLGWLQAILFLLLVHGCATQPPLSVRVDLTTNPTITDVLQDFATHNGMKVRWGGVIYKVANLKDFTEFEVIGRELDESAQPKIADISSGRFIVRINGFLEPSIYAPNREITVVGTITGQTTRPIGEFEYRYPIVTAESHHLWEERVEADYYDEPWMYDPWYWGYPWYPWWRYY